MSNAELSSAAMIGMIIGGIFLFVIVMVAVIPLAMGEYCASPPLKRSNVSGCKSSQ